MIDYETSFRAHLLDDPAITGVVADRMFPLFLPQGVPLPALVWTIDGENRSPSHYGGLVESFLDLELYLEAKKGYGLAQQLKEDVRLRINEFKGDLSNGFNVRGVFLEDSFKDYIPPSDGKGSGTILFTLEFKIWFREIEAANCP